MVGHDSAYSFFSNRQLGGSEMKRSILFFLKDDVHFAIAYSDQAPAGNGSASDLEHSNGSNVSNASKGSSILSMSVTKSDFVRPSQPVRTQKKNYCYGTDCFSKQKKGSSTCSQKIGFSKRTKIYSSFILFKSYIIF